MNLLRWLVMMQIFNSPEIIANSTDPSQVSHDTTANIQGQYFGLCSIRHTPAKGRGVFATQSIPPGVILEISPVLLFQKEEYTSHGQYTILDHYTFKWKDGKMALALGLGSLFNHSRSPNVTYKLDYATDSILFKSTQAIKPDEELCIFYGHNLWFTNIDEDQDQTTNPEPVLDEWGGLLEINSVSDVEADPFHNAFNGRPGDEIIPECELPFWRFKLPPEEETPESIHTIPAFVVDIRDPRDTSAMLKWLKQHKLDDKLGHLKRVRKQHNATTLTMLLMESTAPPNDTALAMDLPEGLSLSPVYTIQVPASVALTPISHQIKNEIWPTVYAPRRKDAIEEWTYGKAKWAWSAIQVLLNEAAKAEAAGEVRKFNCILCVIQHAEFTPKIPIIAHIPVAFESSDGISKSFTAWDTRTSANHPLHHAVVNVIHQVANYYASHIESVNPTTTTTSVNIAAPEQHNGSHYLLMSHTLFITHEPCIMCSMSLLHSRVKDVVYLYPMEKTGGCGGVTCLPAMKSVNHRFGVMRWTLLSKESQELLHIDDSFDV